ncbi:hypothetical protein Corgl_0542 [Coriobacterium glomerans PW2]|uniref:Integral membrane protein n=1 Tax=Coriobacterium glomerans (strain ATCC 49209 / DSM 20642 / JCM 10262 / PW2) TaxID=700015 RepID=F2NBC1_CORGP|nr:DUF6198 family protein [Coriobacterium glomerans]AEB06657.1 hypothetical protein Corgl_0542 [Coriobacterium glomerans PW2]
MNRSNAWKRWTVYIAGIFILALGVFLNVKSALGISTTNSVPNIVSVAGLRYGAPWLTLGTACTIVYCIDMLFQCIVYRRIRMKVILQLPFSFIFGHIVDMYGSLLALLLNGAELALEVRVVLFAASVLLISIGCTMVVNMDLVPNPPDGGVQALAHLTKLPFGRAKWLWDGILLFVTAGISFLIGVPVLAPNNIYIGTIIAFFAIGNIIHFVNNHFGAWFRDIFDRNDSVTCVPTDKEAVAN